MATTYKQDVDEKYPAEVPTHEGEAAAHASTETQSIEITVEFVSDEHAIPHEPAAFAGPGPQLMALINQQRIEYEQWVSDMHTLFLNHQVQHSEVEARQAAQNADAHSITGNPVRDGEKPRDPQEGKQRERERAERKKRGSRSDRVLRNKKQHALNGNTTAKTFPVNVTAAELQSYLRAQVSPELRAHLKVRFCSKCKAYFAVKEEGEIQGHIEQDHTDPTATYVYEEPRPKPMFSGKLSDFLEEMYGQIQETPTPIGGTRPGPVVIQSAITAVPKPRPPLFEPKATPPPLQGPRVIPDPPRDTELAAIARLHSAKGWVVQVAIGSENYALLVKEFPNFYTHNGGTVPGPVLRGLEWHNGTVESHMDTLIPLGFATFTNSVVHCSLPLPPAPPSLDQIVASSVVAAEPDGEHSAAAYDDGPRIKSGFQITPTSITHRRVKTLLCRTREDDRPDNLKHLKLSDRPVYVQRVTERKLTAPSLARVLLALTIVLGVTVWPHLSFSVPAERPTRYVPEELATASEIILKPAMAVHSAASWLRNDTWSWYDTVADAFLPVFRLPYVGTWALLRGTYGLFVFPFAARNIETYRLDDVVLDAKAYSQQLYGYSQSKRPGAFFAGLFAPSPRKETVREQAMRKYVESVGVISETVRDSLLWLWDQPLGSKVLLLFIVLFLFSGKSENVYMHCPHLMAAVIAETNMSDFEVAKVNAFAVFNRCSCVRLPAALYTALRVGLPDAMTYFDCAARPVSFLGFTVSNFTSRACQEAHGVIFAHVKESSSQWE